MKRTFGVVLVAFICGIVCACFLVACNTGNQETHTTHNWSSTYTEDGDRHYQTCDGCNEKQYSAHDYGTSGVCFCGAANAVDGHTHNYQWVNNGDGTHKQHCSVSGCANPDVNSGNHNYGTSGICVCGTVKPVEGQTQYNIIFNANGGKIDGNTTKTIVGKVNQTISRPNDPIRSGYTFTGWYKDGATTTLWNFATDTIKGATTLYAGWEMDVTDYDVTFVLNYSGSANVIKSTENGLITYIPERSGYIFNGWWYSDGEIDGNYILSEKFDTSERVTQSGLTLYAEWVQQRTDNSQLYSPSVSISADGVFSWQAVQNAQSYRVEVYFGSTKIVEETLNVTSWTFPNGTAAGYYTVKVRANGNGESTINSVYTEKYYAHHILGAVSGIEFNVSTSVLTWSAVNKATAYEVRVNNSLEATISYTTYDLSDLDAGDYAVSVTATREGYSSSTATKTISKKRLTTPNITVVENPSDCTYTISWAAVTNANTYRIKHHSTYITVTGTSYTISNDSPIYNSNGVGEFTICAYDTNADYFISDDSESFTVKKIYTLMLNCNDSAAGVVSSAKQGYKVGETVTISASTNRGYTWLGWYKGTQKLTNELNYTFIMPSENISYTAKWDLFTLTVNGTEGGTVIREYAVSSYTIDFDLNGGTGTVPSQTVTETVGLTYPKPSRSGYLFGGWYDNSECAGIPYDFSQGVEDNITLYAKWVSFGNDSTLSVSGSSSTISYDFNTLEYAPWRAFVPIVDGTIRARWTRVSGSGYFYLYDSEKNQIGYGTFSNNSPELEPTFTVKAGQLYYARLISQSIYGTGFVDMALTQDIPSGGKAYFPLDGGVKAGTTVTLTANTEEGWTFIGWYNGTSELSKDLNYTFVMPAYNVTYIAKWCKVTIENDNEAYGTVSILDNTYKVGERVTITATPNSGFSFIGWYKGTQKLTDELSYKFNMPSENVTYIAKWTYYTLSLNTTDGGNVSINSASENTIFTVNFNLAGGSGTIDSQTITETQGLIYPEYPTRNGYVFGGWYNNSSCSGNRFDFSAPVVENTTLYAKWIAHSGDYVLPTDPSKFVTSEIIKNKYYAFVPLTTTGCSFYANTSCIRSHTVTIYNSSKTSVTEFNVSNGSRYESGYLSVGSVYYVKWTATNCTHTDLKFRLETQFQSQGGTANVSDVQKIITANQSVTIAANRILGYNFLGWYDGNQKISDNLEFTFTMPNKNLTYTAKFELDPLLTSFTYTSTSTTFTITGVKDKSVTQIILPSYVTSIEHSAFSGCSSLTSITIPDSVTSINNGTFSNCTSLTSVTIGNSVTYIGGAAFSGCSALTSITIPNSVTSIYEQAFSGCSALTSITIPDSVTYISYDVFRNTAYYNNTSNWENGVLYINNHLIKAETSISGSYTIKAGTLIIAGFAFSGCRSLTSITIPDSVTTIGENAFFNCSGLTSVTIPDSVTSIDNGAFSNCTSLTSVTIGNSVTYIGGSAFSGCSALTSIIIPNSVTSIGYYAFNGCSNLTSVTFGNTSGWWYASSSTATSGTSISNTNLSNKSTAATYLTTTYYSYYWNRSDD